MRRFALAEFFAAFRAFRRKQLTNLWLVNGDGVIDATTPMPRFFSRSGTPRGHDWQGSAKLCVFRKCVYHVGGRTSVRRPSFRLSGHPCSHAKHFAVNALMPRLHTDYNSCRRRTIHSINAYNKIIADVAALAVVLYESVSRKWIRARCRGHKNETNTAINS